MSARPNAEPVVRAVEHVAFAQWAAREVRTVARPLDAARASLVLALSDRDAQPWACLIATRHLSVALRLLAPVDTATTPKTQAAQVAHGRIAGALTALAEHADAHLHALAPITTNQRSESAPEPPWSLGAGRPSSRRSKAVRRNEKRAQQGRRAR